MSVSIALWPVRRPFVDAKRSKLNVQIYSQNMHMPVTHPLRHPIQASSSKNAPNHTPKTPRFAMPNPVYCTPLPNNRILQNHTPLRPTIILRPPYLLPLATAAHQPPGVNNMTALERQRERLRVRIRQHQSVREWIERESRVVRPVGGSDRGREWRQC